MPRKKAANIKRSHAFQDLTGLALIALAVLLFFAFWSYNPDDVHRVPPKEEPDNWVGIIGAWAASGGFFALGAAAYLIPLFLVGWGVSCFSDTLAYLRRRWGAALLLVGAGAGALDLYDAYFPDSWRSHLATPSVGGLLGETINRHVFEAFGSVGASTLFSLIFLFCLVAFTDYRLRLRGWIGAWMERRRAKRESKIPREKKLRKRARDLAKEARRLEEEVKRAGRPSDSEAEPTPVVRDHSAPGEEAAVKKGGLFSLFRGSKRSESTAAAGSAKEARTVPAASKEEILAGGVGTSSGSSAPANGSGSPRGRSPAGGKESGPVVTDASAPRATSGSRKKQRLVSPASGPATGDYQLPSLDHLHHPEPPAQAGESKENLMANARLMQSTLAQFGIEVTLGNITKGPTVTRFELHPAPGVKLEKISNLSNNIAAALQAERINILAPIPGKSAVGIEVPNRIKTQVVMRELMESPEWQKSKAAIPLALGKDVYGEPVVGDLAEMPHMLIAGSTGSGKSVCINSIIASLLYQFSPDDLRFVMIDPKVVELQHYNSLPHLAVPVVTEPKKVVMALKWVVSEMEKRYQIFAKAGVRNIQGFNRRSRKAQETRPAGGKNGARNGPQGDPKGREADPDASGSPEEAGEEVGTSSDDGIEIPEKLSYIVVIIDELADLMLVAPSDVENTIARITQMARAAGIHCIIATQRPSVNVITGVIKANIPARIAFQVASKVDSRTILDAMGADRLIGKGDMLYQPPGASQLMRAQGVLVTDEEIQAVVDAISQQASPSYEVDIHERLQKSSGDIEEGGSNEDEDLIQQCIEIIRHEQKASVSLMQRRLRLGYTRAARIMDELEERGVVGPSRGAEPRQIFVGRE